jgi:hypothetical protein
MSYPFEQYLLRLKDKHQCINPIDNLLFLYDVAQLYDSDEFRTAQFKADLQNFLGLDVPLQDDFEDTGSASYPKGKLKRMDICDAQYMMNYEKSSSKWVHAPACGFANTFCSLLRWS